MRTAPKVLSVMASFISCFVVALACAGIFGCANGTDKQGKIEVQVFITTQGGDNIKLGNVPVVVMDDKTFQHWKIELSGLASRTEPRLKTVIETGLTGLRRGQQMQVSTVSPEYQQLKVMTTEAIASYYVYRSYYFHDLIAEHPEKFSAIYTDADGVASFVVPDKDQNYYIVASAERVIENEHERYCWIQSVQPTKDGRVLLTNNNLWDMVTQGAAMGFKVLPKLPDYPEL
jgi:hypothetical protein